MLMTFTITSSPSLTISVHRLHALVGELGDVDETLGAREDLDEGAELDGGTVPR
jgi:hypothetical protein